MGKDTRLVNIYLKIHHKKVLTMDDLAYLAEYDPECFVKTCRNVVYNIPEAKPIMEPAPPASACDEPEPGSSERQNIEKILERLRRLEKNNLPDIHIDDDTVKSLLGNLYMELLFPHNDQQAFMSVLDTRDASTFDRKA
ncbi:MAG: hypothetical protein NC420_10425 [Eubacterium sp.]|nr:hypothetical protein [Eubacterium sp.]MCM1214363.1 hypothetical protein [Lachnospiraceae bacterium]MCM1305308.1 hypothetical protein [Butyrivibrio sp.]MCM1345226.1 hypothetical protein [Muribaculaceae bacterium]MCM1238655.1 hypothetical protein [Lachnospiraceae bacterium]